MKITDVRLSSVPNTRYAPELDVPPALDTSMVAILTDQRIGGERLVGYSFTSIGRFAQDHLVRERFAPRLLKAEWRALMHANEIAIDPIKAWSIMIAVEKPGGHGERCVACSRLDMALWDLAAKARGLPLFRLLWNVYGRSEGRPEVPVYAGGGYVFPGDRVRAASR